MLRNVVEPIVRHAAGFEHISILQGTKVYGVHLHPIPIPARESDPRDRHANFFHDQEDYLREMPTVPSTSPMATCSSGAMRGRPWRRHSGWKPGRTSR
jgi:hypothetical protein